jgi:hypothetical protein
MLGRRFERTLKTQHQKLWASLRDPSALPMFQFRYLYWFWTRGFDRTGDADLSLLGTKLYGANFVLAVVLGIWVISAWLYGFLELR